MEWVGQSMSAQHRDAATRRAILISSPHAGNAISADHLAELLARLGIAVTRRLLVSDLDRAQPQGREWRAQGCDLAIAAGGDGTIGSVATQLAGSDLPLAILPLGTANDVARSFYLPMDIEEACLVLAGAEPMEVDVGQALPGLTEPGAFSALHDETTGDEEPSPREGVAFLHAATLGFNVEFARLATDSLRRQRLGGWTYAASAVEAVTRYRPIDVTLHIFGMEGQDPAAEYLIRSRVVQVSVVNTPVMGGRMGVRLPDVSLRDRQLDFMLIEAIDPQQLLRTVQGLLAALNTAIEQPEDMLPGSEETGENVVTGLPGIRRFRARAAILETDEAVDVTLDGEIRTHTPVVVRVAPHRLRVLVAPEAKYLLTQDGHPDSARS